MDSASETDEFNSASFLQHHHHQHQQHHQSDQYLQLSSGSVDGDDDSRDGDEERSHGVLREQDRFLPIANVARLMKRSIPKTGKIAKDARECVQECVSEFVSFITSEASDRCHQEKRKTINGEDILFAMSSLGFDHYVEPLKLYLQKYREANKGKDAVGFGENSNSGFLSEVIGGGGGGDGGIGIGAGGTSTTTATVLEGGNGGVGATGGTYVLTYDLNSVQQQQQQGSSSQQEYNVE